MPWERVGATGRHDSGVVAVETALISMLLVFILFGIVDTSFLFKDWLTVSAAARAGARMGASQPRAPNFALDSADQVTNAIAGLNTANLQAVWVYRTTAATGTPPASCDSTSKCIPFTWNGTKLTTTGSANWAADTQDACAADVGPSPSPIRDALGVYVKYKHPSPVGFFFKDAIIGESTVMWIEPTFALVCKP